jgi:hypothetical protein
MYTPAELSKDINALITSDNRAALERLTEFATDVTTILRSNMQEDLLAFLERGAQVAKNKVELEEALSAAQEAVAAL